MTLRIALLGFGVVGQALAERLAARDDVRVAAITDRSGTLVDRRGLDLRAALARKKTRGSIGGDAAHDARWAVQHVDADVVVDALPTDLKDGEPSLALQLEALRRGRHVVSASKGALALQGPRLREAARAARRELRASATVCGGTPALELLSGAFGGDRLLRFEGVLNGSTNFVLSRLEKGEAWDEALRAARGKGILETDPSLDLQGLDAAAKAVILANEAWGLGLALRDAEVEGIFGVKPGEAREAAASGMAIRLVVRASPERGVAVAPVMLPRDHALVLDGTENVLRLTLDDAGTITLRGPGAGGRETASALLHDILAIAKRAAAAQPPIATAV